MYVYIYIYIYVFPSITSCAVYDLYMDKETDGYVINVATLVTIQSKALRDPGKSERLRTPCLRAIWIHWPGTRRGGGEAEGRGEAGVGHTQVEVHEVVV